MRLKISRGFFFRYFSVICIMIKDNWILCSLMVLTINRKNLFPFLKFFRRKFKWIECAPWFFKLKVLMNFSLLLVLVWRFPFRWFEIFKIAASSHLKFTKDLLSEDETPLEYLGNARTALRRELLQNLILS